MRRFAATLALATLTLLGTLTYDAPDAAALSGTITLTVQCGGNPERTTVTNNTDAPLDLAGSTIASLVNPRQGVEPFPLSGTLAPGAATTYETGPAATGNVPTRQSIYVDNTPGEGARLTTPYGSVSVLCSAGTGSLAVVAAPAPTATVGQTPTATMTLAPTAPAVATTAPTGTMPAPGATSTPAPTMTPRPTVAPTATIPPTATTPAAMPGLPNTGAGGGARTPGVALPLALLIATLGARGVVLRRSGRGRR